jgi:hypothetical protein
MRRNRRLQSAIENTLEQMVDDLFAINLGTHKLSGELFGL